ncbi:MAG TPA: hypothetical protein VGH32_08950 [Pirellulales bacterium]|jgi:hypothetical protein
MGRTYAGILGTLAFSTMLVRCLVKSVSIEATVGQAIACLAVFAVIGAIAGRLAGWIVDESVRSRLAAEMAAGANKDTKRHEPDALARKHLA